jgi:hypothetical protein
MEKKYFLLLFSILTCIVISGCGPSPEEMQATSAALTAAAATDTPSPSPTVKPTETPEPTNTPIPTPTDAQLLFYTWESEQYPLSISVPAVYSELLVTEGPSAMFMNLSTNERLMIDEIDISALSLSEPTLGALLAEITAEYEADQAINVITVEEILNPNGLLTGILYLDVLTQEPPLKFVELYYVHEEEVILRVRYATYQEYFEGLEPIVLQSFASLSVKDN